MSNVAVVIDSTCYMSAQEVERRGYEVIPLNVNFDDVVYKEKHDGGEQSHRVFKEVYSRKKLPKTSQPMPGDVIEVFDRLVEKGYTKIITFHISEELSGTSRGVRVLADQYLEENDIDLQIEVINTRSAAQVSGIIANEVDDIVKDKGDITLEEIEEIIKHYTEKIKVFFFVDDLNFLHYGGRIPQALAATGKILGIAPILTLNLNGGIEKYKVERSQKKGILNVLKNLEEEKYDKTDDIILMTAHIEAEKKATKLLKLAKERVDCNFVQVEVSNMGIVIGNHLGPGALGIGWVPKYKGVTGE